MSNISIVRWLRNVPIATKLYFTVGIMALLIATELGTLFFAINTLSSVRAYVGAEGLWSKAQKDAVYFLQKYAKSRDKKDYDQYLHFLKVPMGDRKDRLELMKPHPDLSIAREGLMEGRVHPDDIDGAIKLVRRFHNISYIHKALEIWGNGDVLMSQLMDIGDRLHKEIVSPNASQEKINAILDEIDPLNTKLTRLEDDFSFTLGEGSRWLTNLVLELLLGWCSR